MKGEERKIKELRRENESLRREVDRMHKRVTKLQYALYDRNARGRRMLGGRGRG